MQSFEFWCKKLRISPYWDTRLEFDEDFAWRKTGDIKIDCADRKAIILINKVIPNRKILKK